MTDDAAWPLAISRIPRPILILRDEADGVVLPFEPYMLLKRRACGGIARRLRERPSRAPSKPTAGTT